MTDERFWSRNFASLDDEHSQYERARVVVLPVPYDSTASGWVGSREGPAAIIEAASNMELSDIGIGSEPYTGAVGAVRAYAKRTPSLSVLAFDAHADLRDSYMDSPYSHACTLRRAQEHAPVVQVGLRSAERGEHDFIREGGRPFYSPQGVRA